MEYFHSFLCVKGEKMTLLEKKIFVELEPIINNIGIKLYDIIYEKDGKYYYLKVFLDKDGGINIDDCENVNNVINDILDEKDFIKGQYYLEVSSAGVERVLRLDKHFEENIGNDVQVNLFKPINKIKSFIGKLKKFDDDKIVIENDKVIEINRKDISLIKIVFDWDSI